LKVREVVDAGPAENNFLRFVMRLTRSCRTLSASMISLVSLQKRAQPVVARPIEAAQFARGAKQSISTKTVEEDA
jgi:hypothetical protein